MSGGGILKTIANVATLGGYSAYESAKAQKKANAQQAEAQARANRLQEEANTQAEQQNNRANALTVTDYSDQPDKGNAAILTNNNGANDGYSLGSASLLGGDDEDLY